MASIIEETIQFLFKELNKINIPIVVLRNYQHLPDVGNDLDAGIYSKDIKIIRRVFKTEYIQSRWNKICEVKTHNSSISEHNIFVFKFFNIDLDKYLQIDFFSGFLFKGQPLFSADSFINEKREIKGFPIVSIQIELTIKYFQILSAIKNNQWERVNKYTNQAKELSTELKNNTSTLNFNNLNILLVSKYYKKYSVVLQKYRRKKLVRLAINHPIVFIKNILFRIGSFYRIFITDPFIVSCTISKGVSSKIIKEVLIELTQQQCFRYYYISSETSHLSKIKKYLQMAQGGGVIIKFSHNGKPFKTKNEIKSFIINEFVNRHTQLYK